MRMQNLDSVKPDLVTWVGRAMTQQELMDRKAVNCRKFH